MKTGLFLLCLALAYMLVGKWDYEDAVLTEIDRAYDKGRSAGIIHGSREATLRQKPCDTKAFLTYGIAK